MPTFQLELQFNDQGANAAVTSFKRVGSAADGATRAIREAGEQGKKTGTEISKSMEGATARVKGLATQIIGLVGAYKALDGVLGFIRRGMDFSANLESSQTAIASVVAAVTNISDAQGKNLEGVEKFNAANEITASMMEEIQILALQTTATYDSLVAGISGIVAPATQAGIALEKLPKFAVTAAQAMGAMKLPIQQMRTELGHLLTGNINQAQDQLAHNLNITNDMVKSWQKQGILVQEIEKRLVPFALAGAKIADSWDGLKNNMEDALDYLTSKTGKGIFEGAKQSYRELLALLVSTEGKVGIGEDFENIAGMITRIQDAIGNELLETTKTLIEYLKELNKPENLAELEKTIDNIVGAARTAFSIMKDVGGAILDVGKSALDAWSALPETIREWGLIIAIIGGKRGLLGLTAGLALADKIVNVGKGFAAFASGDLKFTDFATMNGTELKEYLDKSGIGSGLSSLLGSDTAKSTTDPGLISSHSSQSTAYTTSSATGGNTPKTKSKGQSNNDSAKARLQELQREIEVLDGSSEKFSKNLSKKLEEIAKAGKDAGLSVSEISALQDKYTEAFKTDTLKRFDAELAKIKGDTQALQQIEFDKTISNWKIQLEGLKLPADEVESRLAEMKIALERQQQFKDLKLVSDFYKDLAAKSGQYGASIEYQNKLINMQALAWEQNHIPIDDILKMTELMRDELSRDPFVGLRRGLRAYEADASNAAKTIESAVTKAFDGMTDSLTDFVMTGKISFNSLTNSIIKDMVRMAMQASVTAPLAGLLGKGLGMLGGLVSGGSLFDAGYQDFAKDGIMSAVAWTAANGGVASGGNLSAYSGSIVSSPTMFNYGKHFSAFASGAGLMGEAGPEAIMPLGRTGSGRLGVDVTGLGANKPNVQVFVNIENNTDAQVETRSSTDQNGMPKLDVFIRMADKGLAQLDAAGKSEFGNSLNKSRGLSRAGSAFR